MASPTKVTATKVTATKVIPSEEKVSSNGIKYKVGKVPYGESTFPIFFWMKMYI